MCHVCSVTIDSEGNTVGASDPQCLVDLTDSRYIFKFQSLLILVYQSEIMKSRYMFLIISNDSILTVNLPTVRKKLSLTIS